MTQTLRRLLHEEPSLQTCEASIRQHEDELRSTGFVLPPFGECEEEACPDEHRPKFFFDPDWFERVHRKLTVYGVEMIVNGVHYKRIFWSDLTQRHVLVDTKYVEALNKAVSSLFHGCCTEVIAIAYIEMTSMSCIMSMMSMMSTASELTSTLLGSEPSCMQRNAQ